MPAMAATIKTHRDADYPGHHPAEINFWTPLTAVSDSSALWLESSPDAADFAPRNLEVRPPGATRADPDPTQAPRVSWRAPATRGRELTRERAARTRL